MSMTEPGRLVPMALRIERGGSPDPGEWQTVEGFTVADGVYASLEPPTRWVRFEIRFEPRAGSR